MVVDMIWSGHLFHSFQCFCLFSFQLIKTGESIKLTLRFSPKQLLPWICVYYLSRLIFYDTEYNQKEAPPSPTTICVSPIDGRMQVVTGGFKELERINHFFQSARFRYRFKEFCPICMYSAFLIKASFIYMSPYNMSRVHGQGTDTNMLYLFMGVAELHTGNMHIHSDQPSYSLHVYPSSFRRHSPLVISSLVQNETCTYL